MEAKAKVKKVRAKPEICYDCGEQGRIGANCPRKWTNSFDDEDDQGSSWES